MSFSGSFLSTWPYSATFIRVAKVSRAPLSLILTACARASIDHRAIITSAAYRAAPNPSDLLTGSMIAGFGADLEGGEGGLFLESSNR